MKTYFRLSLSLLYWIFVAPFRGERFKLGLQQLGAETYVPDLVMVTLFREMGPVLIAVIVIGRSGSTVAAELGTMKVSEEIEALEVMAINPISYLIVPRFLAMMVMLPALTILGNYVGVLGGWAVCRFALSFDTAGYILRALESANTWDLYSGVIKSVVFAWIVITVACNAGFRVEGGAEASARPQPDRSCRRFSLLKLIEGKELPGVLALA